MFDPNEARVKKVRLSKPKPAKVEGAEKKVVETKKVERKSGLRLQFVLEDIPTKVKILD
jgi:hypothetical protein